MSSVEDSDVERRKETNCNFLWRLWRDDDVESGEEAL